MAIAALLCLNGCKQHDPEPDYSGLQNLTYSVQQKAGSAAGGNVGISVAPNPFVHEVKVSLYDPNTSTATISFSDERGKYTKRIAVDYVYDGISVRAAFDGMPKGVYICEVQLGGQVSRYRLIKAN